jgi:hypothetical protein
MAFDRADHASVELPPGDHRPVVAKSNAVGALQRLGLNFCGGEALDESARSIRWRESVIWAGVTGKERHVVFSAGTVCGRNGCHNNGVGVARASNAENDDYLAKTPGEHSIRP